MKIAYIVLRCYLLQNILQDFHFLILFYNE